MPVCPSSVASSRSARRNRACVRRLGLKSSASIERDRSSTITRASRAENELFGNFCQLGPARARMQINKAIAASQRPPPRLFSFACVTLSQRSKWGSQTRDQSPEGLRLRCHHQGRMITSGNKSSQYGRMKCSSVNVFMRPPHSCADQAKSQRRRRQARVKTQWTAASKTVHRPV